MAKTTQVFQAEIQQLLDLMIHSLYSHKEIFLRELISNSSDAIDKIKFLALTDQSLIKDSSDFQIRIETDPKNKTLKIIDNGIGMNKEEVIKNLGTIAHSGTKEFLKQAQKIKDKPELIGQFGVGFYSSFMVSEKVVVHTQKAGTNEGVFWESSGDGSYSVDDIPRTEGHGTSITLFLKEFGEDEEVEDFSDAWTIKRLIKKHSDFISYPIKMMVEKTAPKEGSSETTSTFEDEILNSQKALWLKSPSEVKEEEYKEFYKHLTHDWQDPMKTIHYRAEGTMEYSALMYIPTERPWNYFYRDSEYGMQLYIKRVFIMGDSKDLLPQYLRFVKGIVDSNDLSLNVSREILQQDRQVTAIRKGLTTKVLNTLKEMLTKDRAGYEKFWSQFGSSFKEGVSSDAPNKEKISECFLFNTTQSDKLTTFDEYIERMKPEQDKIFFIVGDSLSQVSNSPYLEKIKEKGFEVLLMADPVDEWVADAIQEYKGKKLQSAVRDDLELDTPEQKKTKEDEFKKLTDDHKEFLGFMKKVLDGKVSDIRFSDRLTQTPACLVSDSHGPSAHMEKILSQINKESSGSGMKARKILEINHKHALFDKMIHAKTEKQAEWAEILYGQALLNEGSTLEDPMKFSQMVTKLMLDA